MVAWSVKASNLHSVEVCTSARGGSNPTRGYDIDIWETEMFCCKFQIEEHRVAYAAYDIEPSEYT